MPGAVILAANAALRAGAGKLKIATCGSIAPFVGIAVPEALVLPLAETPSGSFVKQAGATVGRYASSVGAVLIGPGMTFDDVTSAVVQQAITGTDATVILDAAALKVLNNIPDLLHEVNGNAVLTPHAGEMASLLGRDKQEILDDPLRYVREAAEKFRAVVALKGARTYIAGANGEVYCNKRGNVGLATSGSGDALAGIASGLAARGTSALQATIWAVFLHARAGDRLAKRVGTLGFLARELLAEIPALMSQLSPMHPSRTKSR